MENRTNLTTCDDCGTEYCVTCGHNGCPGGRWVPDGTTGPDTFMDGKRYREHLKEQEDFVRRFQNHQ